MLVDHKRVFFSSGAQCSVIGHLTIGHHHYLEPHGVTIRFQLHVLKMPLVSGRVDHDHDRKLKCSAGLEMEW